MEKDKDQNNFAYSADAPGAVKTFYHTCTFIYTYIIKLVINYTISDPYYLYHT